MIFICCRHHISLMILSLGLCCYFGIEESFFVASVNPSSIRRQCHQSSWLSVSRQNAILKYRGGEKGENEPEDEDKQASEEEVKIADTATDKNTNDSFEILEEKVVYSGWRTIVQRMIRLRNGKVANFDLVGVKTGDGAVLIFVWDTKTKTVTMIREYMPGSNKILWGLAAGLIETDKHGNDPRIAAQHELEEECHLSGGTWVPLSKVPAAMDKYALTTINAYLVIDPMPAMDPKPLDDEEDIEIVDGITIPQIYDWITTGEMNLVSAWGCMLAIEKLREMGEYN